MSKPHPVALFGFLVAVLVVLGGLTIAKDGLYIGKHEGDALHLLDVVQRLADGKRIHQDFMTPLGILAFWPILIFVELGYGIGHALIYSQLLVAVLLLPAIWWLGYSRLSNAVAYLAGGYLMVLALALVYGAAETSSSMSMHYNRWAWVLAYLAILLALLPNRQRQAQTVDGVIIGLAMAILVLLKVTYFAAFAIPVMLALIMRGAYRTIIAAVIAGGLVAAIATAWGGIVFWIAYVNDLRAVSGSEIRAAPGLDLNNLIRAPDYLGINFILLGGVVLLRQVREERAGLILMLLVPGFIYVTYQNFGNDPQWLMLLVILLLTYRPEGDLRNGFGWNMHGAFNIAAGVAMAFAVPSFLNLAYSPWRHFQVETKDYVPVVPRATLHADMQTEKTRALVVNGLMAMDGPGSGLEHYRTGIDHDNVVTVNDEELKSCQIERGMSAVMDAIAVDLETRGYAGARIYEADILELLPVFGDFQRLDGGAPWYYGGTPGIDSAQYVMVPICSLRPIGTSLKLAALKEQGIELKELYRTSLYILLEKLS